MYSKPELLSVEVALDAIRGVKDVNGNFDVITLDYTSVAPAYEVDE